MSQGLSPLPGGSNIASSVAEYRKLHHNHSETSDLDNSRTYTRFVNGLAAEKGAVSAFVIKEKVPRTKMVQKLEPCFSEDDKDDDTTARIQDQRRTSFDPARDTFATINDTSSSVVTSSIISTSEHDSDFSLRNHSTLEKSMAELQAARDATHFTREFQEYDERRAEQRKGRKAERRVRFVEEAETQDSTREGFHTPEPTSSRTPDAHPNSKKEPLRKRTVVASGGSNARLQLDGEVNQVYPPTAKSRSTKAKKLPQVGRKERGRRRVEEIFPCKTCLRPFTSKSSARRHAHTHLNCDELKRTSIYHEKCPHCQKVFFVRRDFADHVGLHEGRKKHDCLVCKMKFTRKTSLTSHHFLHLSGEEQAEVKRGWRHVCYFCDKRFKAPSHLSRHLPTHTKEKVGGSCPLCRKTFSCKRYLARHCFLHLNEDEKTALVTKGSSRVCLFCGKMFPDNVTYRSHLGTHTEEFRCHQCGKIFTRNSALTEHKRRHSVNPKPFKCDSCGQAFSHKHHLTSHTKTVHRKVKDIACPRCNKKFGTKSIMVTHLKGVHLKMRHPCPHCGVTFTTKSNAWSHIKRIHPS